MNIKKLFSALFWAFLLASLLEKAYPNQNFEFVYRYGGYLGPVFAVAMLVKLWLKAKKNPPYKGLLGGTVCPSCQHPYALHWWGINLLTKRYDRCPHCGKWHAVTPQNDETLQHAAVACGMEPYIDDFGIDGRRTIIQD